MSVVELDLKEIFDTISEQFTVIRPRYDIAAKDVVSYREPASDKEKLARLEERTADLITQLSALLNLREDGEEEQTEEEEKKQDGPPRPRLMPSKLEAGIRKVSQRIIQLNSQVASNKVEIEAQETEILELNTQIAALKGEISELKKEVGEQADQITFERQRVAMLEQGIRDRDAEIEELRGRPEAGPLRLGLRRVAEIFARKYSTNSVLPEELSDPELIKEVKALVLNGPPLESDIVDPTPIVLQKLKALNESISQTATLEEELEITSTTIRDLRTSVMRLEALTSEAVDSVQLLLRQVNEPPTGGLRSNMSSVGKKVREIVAEHHAMSRECETLKTEMKNALLMIAYALPGEFDESIPVSNYAPVIAEEVKSLRTASEAAASEIANRETALNEIQGIVEIVAAGLAKLLGQNPPNAPSADSLRTIAARVEKLVESLRVVEKSVAQTQEAVKGRLKKIGDRLSVAIPSAHLDKDLDAIWDAVSDRLARFDIAVDENGRLIAFLTEMCSLLHRSLPPKPTVDDLIDGAKSRLPGLEGSLRMEVINRMLHRRGDPVTYLPELQLELEMHERVFATIKRFGSIFNDLFNSFPGTFNTASTDFSGFVKTLQDELPVVARSKIEPFVADFLSKLVSFISAFLRSPNERQGRSRR
jgi:predicted  nucleic acid-binding Zn-ribbon protein